MHAPRRSRELLAAVSFFIWLGANDAYGALDGWLDRSAGVPQAEGTFNVIPSPRSQPKQAAEKPRSKEAATSAAQQILGEDFELSATTLFVFMLSVFPVGVIMIYLSCKVVGQLEEDLGGKSFVAAFFHRLMFTVAFWILVITEAYGASPTGGTGTVFLTDLAVAVVAIGWWIPDSFGRVVLISLIFCVLDMFALAGVMLGSVLLFS
jgi:hypothetical protein